MKLARTQLDQLIKEELVLMIKETPEYRLFKEGKITEAEFLNKIRGMGKWAKGAAMGAGMLGSLAGATLPAGQAQAASTQQRSNRAFEFMDVTEALQDYAKGLTDTKAIDKLSEVDKKHVITFTEKARSLASSDPELFQMYLEEAKSIRTLYGDQLTDDNIKNTVAAAALGLVSAYANQR
mgnify:CR=1 FL=1